MSPLFQKKVDVRALKIVTQQEGPSFHGMRQERRAKTWKGIALDGRDIPSSMDTEQAAYWSIWHKQAPP
ncbi:hypothetical protein Hypma_012187 [Hypsizygus marmoreus]|uniref:Uncharacterized protein n=1 Tax=Hypsizygus marmoreus TaxID=39966 RepID=A0A369JPN4_HYPMA|nr:hypothetical protein Hypma_012187 [Hypsizygus marmoreus]